MKRVSKILALLFTFIMLLSIGITPAFAASSDSTSVPQTKMVDESTLALDSTDFSAHKSFSASLASELRGRSPKDYDSIVSSFCSKNSNPVFDSTLTYIKNNSSKTRAIYLKTDSNFYKKYSAEYAINPNTTLIVTPTGIEIDTLNSNTSSIISANSISAAAATSSVSGTCSKTYYNRIGTKAISLTVTCNFYYDGSKAWYKDGFDYYYTRGVLSIWQVSNWKGWKETSGTSYNAYCSGNFHWGIEYQGVGLVIEDYYCKNTLSCSKTGTITKTCTYTD